MKTHGDDSDPKNVTTTTINPSTSFSTSYAAHHSDRHNAILNRDIQMTDDDVLLGNVPWTIEQHKAFVGAIFEIGLKSSSPSVIMENMRKHPKYITRERTKSHLQKYRITKDRNKQEFLKEYETLLVHTERVKEETTKAAIEKGKEPPISKVILNKALEGKKATKLIGGEAAALLTFSVLNKCSTDHGPDHIPYRGIRTSFPTMTEEEKQSSLGASLLFVKGLLHNMTDVLLKQRHGITGRPPKNSVVADDSSYSESSEGEEYYDDEEDEEQDNNKKPPPPTAATSAASIPLHSKSQKRKLPPGVSSDKSKHHPVGPHNPYNFPYPPGAYPGGPPPPFHRPPGAYPYPPAPYYGGPPRPMPPLMHGAYPPPPPHYNQPPYVNPYGAGHHPHYPPPDQHQHLTDRTVISIIMVNLNMIIISTIQMVEFLHLIRMRFLSTMKSKNHIQI